jgi:DNA-binding transcriptional LysR family regulator
MPPELLETFLDLAETRSFNRTAERLGLSQSTVSARIGALEEALGERLFQRSRAGTRPTAAGERFVGHARTLRHAWAEARRSVARAGEREGLVRLGLQHDLAAALPSFVSAVRAVLPANDLYVELDYSAQMCADVLSGALDMALVYTPRLDPDLSVEPMGRARYVMVSTHAATLAEVVPDRTVRANYAAAFDAAHRALHPALDRAPLGAGVDAGVAGLIGALGGSGYVRAGTAAAMEAAGTARPVAGAEPIDQPVYAVVHARNRTRALHRRLVALARRHVADGGGERLTKEVGNT